jgi:hypothetical protein
MTAKLCVFLFLVGLGSGCSVMQGDVQMQGGGSEKNISFESADGRKIKTPQELVAALKILMRQHVLTNNSELTEDKVFSYIGGGYKTRSKESRKNYNGYVFDDYDNVYKDAGGLTELGKNPPVINTVAFTKEIRGGKALGYSIVTLRYRDGFSKELKSEMVVEAFGTPDSVSPGNPILPPPHAKSLAFLPKKVSLGNSWLKYNFKDKVSDGFVNFRTIEDGTVVEISIRQEEM